MIVNKGFDRGHNRITGIEIWGRHTLYNFPYSYRRLLRHYPALHLFPYRIPIECLIGPLRGLILGNLNNSATAIDEFRIHDISERSTRSESGSGPLTAYYSPIQSIRNPTFDREILTVYPDQ